MASKIYRTLDIISYQGGIQNCSSIPTASHQTTAVSTSRRSTARVNTRIHKAGSTRGCHFSDCEDDSRLLLQSVPSTEGKRRHENHNQPQASQQPRGGAEVQDANTGRLPTDAEDRRICGTNRLEGRLFSCTYPQSITSLTPTSGGDERTQTDPTVQCTAIRTLGQPIRIHTDCEHVRQIHPTERNQDIPVPRRLAAGTQLADHATTAGTIRSETTDGTRSRHQHGEEPTSTSSVIRVSQDKDRPTTCDDRTER